MWLLIKGLVLNLLVFPGMGQMVIAGRRLKGFLFGLVFMVSLIFFLYQSFAWAKVLVKSEAFQQEINQLARIPGMEEKIQAARAFARSLLPRILAEKTLADSFYLMIILYLLPVVDLFFCFMTGGLRGKTPETPLPKPE